MPLLTHNELRITRHTVPLKRLPTAFDGFRLVQISDLHFYEYSDAAYYTRVMAEVNALEPDAIAMTGDVVHYGSDYIELAASFLRRLDEGPAKLAILGNHDYNDGAYGARIAEMLGQVGFTMLKNSNYCLERDGHRLWFAGLDDLWYGRPNLHHAFEGISPVGSDGVALSESFASQPATSGTPGGRSATSESATIVLTHNPLLFDPLALAAPSPVDLVLAGHTHAGHVYIPFLGPIYRRIFRMKYRYGLYEKQGCHLHVTSGVGSAAFYLKKHKLGLPRFRFNTNPEIAVLTLVQG
jgi:predicted MPP superfamily phosphohydrolase